MTRDRSPEGWLYVGSDRGLHRKRVSKWQCDAQWEQPFELLARQVPAILVVETNNGQTTPGSSR